MSDIHTLTEKVEKLEKAVTELEGWAAEMQSRMVLHNNAVLLLQQEFRQTRPVVYNCPKCHRKVGENDTSCGMCSHSWG